MNVRQCLLSHTLVLLLVTHAMPCLALDFHVSPAGSDDAPGTRTAPFRTTHRAQSAVRAAVADMKEDIVVNLAPREYRIAQTLVLTEADSGHNGHRVVYRSAGGLGQARLLGSVPLVGWQPHRDGIWKVALPEGMTFHTLYENGKRAWKARFPNYEHHPDMPTARGRYLVSIDGSPKSEKGEKTGWLIYRPEDAPPVTEVTKMKILLFAEGRCDWFRGERQVRAIEPKTHRVTFAGSFWRGVKAQARFFFENELGFLDAPGEFFIDETASVLYYMPMGKAHPDTLGITAPVLKTLIRIQGKSRDQCVENLRLEGLGLEETDGSPANWWGTYYGRRDAALIWLSNAHRVEIRRCHLRNSGRNGIMMVGHNTNNRVTGCWIEHMAVNGVTLCNRFTGPDRKTPTQDRCEGNRVHNCRVHDVGEIHCYAGCVNVFNVSHNEVSHCELFNSVRYGVTLRGNGGTDPYVPPAWNTKLPGAKGNRFHHLRVHHCGQDSGDMGALHAANLNILDGDCINTFEQITVADTRAIPSMKDLGPGGIFLDWPRMTMHQIFRSVHILRSQGQQMLSNGPDNAASAQMANVSWEPGFREELMDYETIGLTAEFPAEYGGPPPVPSPLAAPTNVKAAASAYHSVALSWDAPEHKPGEQLSYTVLRNDEKIAVTQALRLTDRALKERTVCRYRVAAKAGDFTKLGARSKECAATTPLDLVPPALTGGYITPDGKHVRIAFTEPMDPATALTLAHYRFDPRLEVKRARQLSPECIELEVAGFRGHAPYALAVVGVRDASLSRNAVAADSRIALAAPRTVVSYPLRGADPGRLRDASGGGADALLHGGAVVQPNAGPLGGAALVLDGETGFAEASADLDLGDGDFTIMLWVCRMNSGTILSKGNGFGSVQQWSLGWPKAGVPGSVSLRVNNNFFSTAPGSVPHGRWVHLAYVKRGDTCKAYADGQASAELHDLSGLGPFVNDYPLRIGRREHAPNPAFFKGKIAGVMLLSCALPLELIQAHARGTAGRADD